jgi:hypothetical protein
LQHDIYGTLHRHADIPRLQHEPTERRHHSVLALDPVGAQKLGAQALSCGFVGPAGLG